MATLGTEESGPCLEVAVMGRPIGLKLEMAK